MTSLTETMTSAEAAVQLGVGMRQVERLLVAGDITRVGTAGRTALIDAASVHRLRIRGVRRGRPWACETSYAAIDLLSSGQTRRLGAVDRSRLLSRLRLMSAEDVVRATQGRAEVRRYRASASFIDQIRQVLLLTGSSAINSDSDIAMQFGLAVARRDEVDGYIDMTKVQDLISRAHLIEDAQGNVTLRVVDQKQSVGQLVNAVTVALDLADSLDSRERSAALELLRSRKKNL